MKKKLISFDAFKKIESDSLSNAQEELIGAEDVLAQTLETDGLELHCFGESDVTYCTPDNHYIHANYQINKGKVLFENIEEVMVEQDSEKKHARQVLNTMVEAILDNNTEKAKDLFDEYITMPVVRREIMTEGFKVTASKPTGKRSKLYHKRQPRSLVAKRMREMKKTKRRLKMNPGLTRQLKLQKMKARKKLGGSKSKRWRVYARKAKMMKEWQNLSENVLGFVDYKAFGPILQESAFKHDEKGNVIAVAIPSLQARNEGKILSFNWKTMDHEVKVLRNGAKVMAEDTAFCKVISDLKRCNAASDNKGLEENLENIVTKFPTVLYLTQTELAKQIDTALETVGATNYADQDCEFMAEGILRIAHQAYSDKVNKIIGLSGKEIDKNAKDQFVEFKNIVDTFYPTLDESDTIEIKVFNDLLITLNEIYKVADDNEDERAKAELAGFMNQCESVLERKVKPDMDLAEDIALFINDLMETNLEMQNWDVEDNAHVSATGEHPAASQWSKKSYSPASDASGDWGDLQPVSDGKSYKKGADDMKSSWTGLGGKDVYPDLSNPFLTKPGEWTMKGEKGVDKDDDELGTWQSSDTFDKLTNPYLPTSVIPKRPE